MMTAQKGKPREAPVRGLPRRRFLRVAAAAGAFSIVPRHVIGGNSTRPPSEKLNLAGVGLGVTGAENLRASETENIVALCDVDWATLRCFAEKR